MGFVRWLQHQNMLEPYDIIIDAYTPSQVKRLPVGRTIHNQVDDDYPSV